MSASSPRALKILLVSYFYPPQNIIGARRPFALAKWLRRRGHSVRVLSSVRTLRDGDSVDEQARYTRDLLTSRLNWRRGSIDVITGHSDQAWTPGANFWGWFFVPDVQLISWIPFAIAAGLRMRREGGLDAVITTSPIESAHGVGLALRVQGVPWIADLRDGWRFEAPRGEWPLRLQRRLDDRLERLVVRSADEVVTISEPLSRDLRSRHRVPVRTITNGFDPEEIVAAPPPPGTIDPAKVSLVHTGGLGGERTLRPVLEALARMASGDPRLHERVELVLAGAQTAEERAMYAEPEFARFVRHVGFLPREQAMALQRAADVLLLVTSGVRTGEATGKLFEYIAAARPILVLGADSAAAEIVVSSGAGEAIQARDTAAAEAVLPRLLAGDLRAADSSRRAAYSYPVLAEQYEHVLEQVVAGRN